jgi:hypothetical protein
MKLQIDAQQLHPQRDFCGVYTWKTVRTEYADKVSCPVCSFEFSHAQRAESLLGHDRTEGGKGYPGAPFGGFVNARRDALAVVFKGECGHMWRIVFQQHKGQTFIEYQMEPGTENVL